MKIECDHFNTPEQADLGGDAFDVGFVGSSIDDRGRASSRFTNSSCENVFEITVFPDTLEYTVNSSRQSVDDLSPLESLLSDNRVLIDATTLGFHEIFLCLCAAQSASSEVTSILYVEPNSYTKIRGRGVIQKRDFNLSSRSGDFVGVPSRVILMRDTSKIKTLVSIGYEGSRLQRLLNQFPDLEQNTILLFGVPPFQAGWDMNAYANIVDEMRDKSLRSVLFAGAANPIGVVRELEKVYSAKREDERMVIVPIGTKPHAIGSALFASIHDDVGVVYDSPQRAMNRSGGVGSMHLYHCRF